MDNIFKIISMFLLFAILVLLIGGLIKLDSIAQLQEQQLVLLAPQSTPPNQSSISPSSSPALHFPSPPAPTVLPEYDAIDSLIMRFVIGGDSRGLYHDEVGTYEGALGGVNTAIVERTMQSVSSLSPAPAFMVTLGDYGMGSSDAVEACAQYEQWLQAATKHCSPSFFYVLYGNHEAKLEGKEGIQIFSDVFSDFIADEFFEPGIYGRTVYYFSRENINFFMLNTNSSNQPHRVSDAVITWMQSKTNRGERNNIFFVHEPAFPTGNHIGRSLDADPQQRDAFWSFVSTVPGAIVFNAHEHQYTRRLVDHTFNDSFINGVYQITSAGMGAPFHYTYTDTRGIIVPPQYAFHYVICDVYPDHIQICAEDLDGNILDEFELMPGGN